MFDEETLVVRISTTLDAERSRQISPHHHDLGPLQLRTSRHYILGREVVIGTRHDNDEVCPVGGAHTKI